MEPKLFIRTACTYSLALMQVEGILKDIRSAVDPYANDGCSTHASDFPGFEMGFAFCHLPVAQLSPKDGLF